MQTTTLSFQNIHVHGELFADILRARRTTFIEDKRWDLPEADGMEFDQYDTPQSRWIAVHHLGQVLARIRLTPTTARCGIYSYMIFCGTRHRSRRISGKAAVSLSRATSRRGNARRCRPVSWPRWSSRRGRRGRPSSSVSAPRAGCAGCGGWATRPSMWAPASTSADRTTRRS